MRGIFSAMKVCKLERTRERMENEFKILEQVTLFAGINSVELSNLLNCLEGKIKRYTKNQSIILVGEEITSLGIVLEGSVQVVREDIMGNRMIVAGLSEGEIFGETFACAGVKESPVSVFTCESTKILWMPIKRIVSSCSSACDFHTRLITNLLQLFARKNLYLNNKMELLSKRNIRDKIMAYLSSQVEQNNSSSFDIPLNRNELADYLCIDRSAMSRELSKLRDQGIIKYKKNNFKIL